MAVEAMSCSRAGKTSVYALDGRNLVESVALQAEGDVKEHDFAARAVSGERAM